MEKKIKREAKMQTSNSFIGFVLLESQVWARIGDVKGLPTRDLHHRQSD